jgi:replicative DNA helicase
MHLFIQFKTQESLQPAIKKGSWGVLLGVLAFCLIFSMQTVAAEGDGSAVTRAGSSAPSTDRSFLFSVGAETPRSAVQSSSRTVGKPGPKTMRSRGVSVNIDRLRQRPGEALNRRLLLNLFDDVVVRAKRTKNYTNPSESSTWIGKVEDIPDGIAIFIVRDNAVYGIVELPHIGNFSIYPNPDGTHTIEQIDEDATLSGEDDSIIPDSSMFPPPAKISSSRAVEISNDDGAIIDVFVAYDQDASGGSVAAADAQSYAELFIAYTNQAYENSDINQRVWLVGVDGFNYTDPDPNSLNADLDAATNGTISGLHAKRDEYHADLVLFLYRPRRPEWEGMAEIIVAKQKNGPNGVVRLNIYEEANRFNTI